MASISRGRISKGEIMATCHWCKKEVKEIPQELPEYVPVFCDEQCLDEHIFYVLPDFNDAVEDSRHRREE